MFWRKKENIDEIEFGIMVVSETPTEVETAAMAQTKELESMAERAKDAKEDETQKQLVNVADTAMTEVKGDGTAEVKADETKGDGEKGSSKKGKKNRKSPKTRRDEGDDVRKRNRMKVQLKVQNCQSLQQKLQRKLQTQHLQQMMR